MLLLLGPKLVLPSVEVMREEQVRYHCSCVFLNEVMIALRNPYNFTKDLIQFVCKIGIVYFQYADYLVKRRKQYNRLPSESAQLADD